MHIPQTHAGRLRASALPFFPRWAKERAGISPFWEQSRPMPHCITRNKKLSSALPVALFVEGQELVRVDCRATRCGVEKGVEVALLSARAVVCGVEK